MRTRQTGIEFATMLDAATGARLGTVLAGRGTEVDIGPQIRAMVAGREYAALHTHPADTPPSAGDALVLVINPPIRLVAVIGVEGTWYVLSRVPGAAVADAVAVRLTFAAALYVLRPRYVALGEAQGMSKAETLASLLDAIWRTIAPRLGLRYDRLDRRRDGSHESAVARPEDRR